MNYVENFISDKADDTHHYTFISSFLSHCLPLLDPDTDPALCHLISSLVSHGDMHAETETGYTSDICDRRSSTATRYLIMEVYGKGGKDSNWSYCLA